MPRSRPLKDFLKQLKNAATTAGKSRLQQARQNADTLTVEDKHYLSLTAANEQYKLAEKVWYVALLTIPLDLILVELDLPTFMPLQVNLFVMPLFLVLCAVATAFSFREFVTEKIQSTYDLIRHRPLVKVLAILVIVLITLAALVLDIVTTSEHGFFSAIIQVLVYGAAIFSMLSGKRQTDTNESFMTLLKRDYFISNTFPIIAARLILPTGILALQVTGYRDDYLTLLALFFVVTLALLELQPRMQHFLARCRRCAIEIPLRLLEKPTCPRCATNLDMKGRANSR